MATFDEFISSLDRDFGEQGKGKPFEAFCKWFLENDPKWSGSVEKVWLWDEYPNKWQGKDLGTDLVFRGNQRRIHVNKSRYHGRHRSLTGLHRNSFMASTTYLQGLTTGKALEAKVVRTLARSATLGS